MTDDLDAEMTALKERGVTCSEVEEQPWGSLSQISLPSGGNIGIYQAKHETALNLP